VLASVRDVVGQDAANDIVSRQPHGEIRVRVEYTLTPFGWQLTELMALYECAGDSESALDDKTPQAGQRPGTCVPERSPRIA
jgi:DNA-binding HxlR family transcriptional regulator